MRRSARIASANLAENGEHAKTDDENGSVTSRTSLASLSNELLVMILGHLTALDVFHCQQTCRRLYEVGLDEQVWKAVYHRQIGPHARRKLLPDENYPTFSWFDHYLLCHSWRYGRCSNYKVEFHVDTQFGIPQYVYKNGWAFLITHSIDDNISWFLATWHVQAQNKISEIPLRDGSNADPGSELSAVFVSEDSSDANLLCLLVSWQDGLVEIYLHNTIKKQTRREYHKNIQDRLPSRDESTRVIAYEHPFLVCSINTPEVQSAQLFLLKVVANGPWECQKIITSVEQSQVLAAEIRSIDPKVSFIIVWSVPTAGQAGKPFGIEECSFDPDPSTVTRREIEYAHLKYPWILYTGEKNHIFDHCSVWEFEKPDCGGEDIIGSRYKILSDLPLGDIACDNRGTLRFLIRPDSLEYHAWHLGGLYPPRNNWDMAYEYVMGTLEERSELSDSAVQSKANKQKTMHGKECVSKTNGSAKRSDPPWWVENQDEGGRDEKKVYARLDDRDFIAEARDDDKPFSLAIPGTIVFDDERILRMTFDKDTELYQLRVNDFSDVVKWYYPERVRTKGLQPGRA